MVRKKDYEIWAISVQSESGDDYGQYIFRTKPTGDKIEAFLRENMPDEWPDRDGPGFRGSCLHVTGPYETGFSD